MSIDQHTDTTAAIDETADRLRSDYAKAVATENTAIAAVKQAEAMLDVARESAAAAWRKLNTHMSRT